MHTIQSPAAPQPFGKNFGTQTPRVPRCPVLQRAGRRWLPSLPLHSGRRTPWQQPFGTRGPRGPPGLSCSELSSCAFPAPPCFSPALVRLGRACPPPTDGPVLTQRRTALDALSGEAGQRWPQPFSAACGQACFSLLRYSRQIKYFFSFSFTELFFFLFYF